MATNFEIDKLDLQILSMLMADAQIPYTEIAKQLDVSGGTVHVRMKKLSSIGVVKGAHPEIEPSKLL
ncbi:MAG: winged helix-turn-helix transcriptional regulator [Bacteroidia bacterium]